ncbi:MAG: carboxypeptidase regulatory-like domain-containing protein [Phycisphaerae bacterium]|nr:carboxypeptidase regulatory-like domain-containing protein [Gemmatimonadaceae bacterium]
MTARGLLALATLSCVAVWALPAQDASQTAVLRGAVTNATGQPLAYAIVSIPALGLQQFSNNEGKFFFVRLTPGKYVVSVRQLGYAPQFKDIVLAPGANETIDVRMERIVTKLATMSVTGQWACNKPGRPMADSLRPLIEVFEQLEQNALRLKLLSEEYPFDFLAERKVVMLRADGSEFVDRFDTLRTLGSTSARYKPGSVVQRIRNPRIARAEYFLQVPTLLDFADPLFQNNHCFLLRGVATNGAKSEIRVDFLPSSKINSPDVGGSVFLEAGSFRLLRAEIYLTKIPASMEGLQGVRATTQFEDIVKGLPTIAEIIGRSDFTAVRGTLPYQHSIEHQKTLQVRFLKAKPAELPPHEHSATSNKPN